MKYQIFALWALLGLLSHASADTRSVHIDLFSTAGIGMRYPYKANLDLGVFLGTASLFRNQRQTHDDAFGDWNDDYTELTTRLVLQGTALYNINEHVFAESRLGVSLFGYQFNPESAAQDDEFNREWAVQLDTLLGIRMPVNEAVTVSAIGGLQFLGGNETLFTENGSDTDYNRRFRFLSAQRISALSVSYAF
ncbi:hypothetical protein ACFOSD_04775 [Salinispirillum marinum]|uniref:Outer membrane protein beta-barrel domain-containing protein n=2 Tax=Saccharospirillaceae TaxID=255527 RepID=A0ABV8BD02_9GAMM